MLITGRIAEYPLSILLEIFLRKGETGLLEISSPTGSGSFYLKDGHLIDAALGNLRGVEAVRFGSTLPDGSFKFSSLLPADYLRRVWEGSLHNVGEGVSYTSLTRTRALPFHTALAQLSDYVSDAYSTLRRVLVSTSEQTQFLTKAGLRFTEKVFGDVAYGLMELGNALTRLLSKLREATAEWSIALGGCEARRRYKTRLKLSVLALRQVTVELLMALHRYEVLLRKQISLKRALIGKRKTLVDTKSKATMSLLLAKLPEVRISLAIITIALLVPAFIFQIEPRTNQEYVAPDATAATADNNKSEAHPKRVRRRRSKRRSVGREKKPTSVAQSEATLKQ